MIDFTSGEGKSRRLGSSQLAAAHVRRPLQQLSKRRHAGRGFITTATCPGEQIDFDGIGDFRQRPYAIGTDPQQQHLLTAADQMHCHAATEGPLTEWLHGFIGERA